MRVLLDLSPAEILELVRALDNRCNWYERRLLDAPPAAETAYRAVAREAERLGVIAPEGES